MICPGFPSENYDLYALGVLDEPEAAEIRGHLRLGCEKCQDAMRTSLAGVSEFALAVQAAHPPRSLRAKIVGLVRPSRAGRLASFRSPAFGLAVLAVVLAAGAGYAVATRTSLGTGVSLTARNLPPPVPQIVIPGAVTSAVTTATEVTAREVERARQESQGAVTAASAELAQQRETSARLSAQLQAKDQQLTATRQEADAAQARYIAVSRDLSQDRTAVETAKKQVAAYQAQVRDLTSQVSLYKTALEHQRHDLDHNVQMVAFLTSPSLRILNLKATEQGGGANARALVSADGKAVFYASQLPALRAGRTYQLWLMRRDGPAIVSGAIFQPNGTNGAMVEVNNPAMLAGLTAMAVTEEPAGGSPLPTGHKILVGLVRAV